jgi:selenocysteine lyase/cysteine desulfurase
MAYLDTAAEGLLLESSRSALLEYLADKSLGSLGRTHMYQIETEAARAAAHLLGTVENNVTFMANATDALNLFGSSIRWTPGDEILITDMEFPSNVVCWLRLRDLGVRVHVIQTRGGRIELDQFVSCLNARTKLVSISQVSYKTGTQIPFMKELAREVYRCGAMFLVDATQALGRVPVTVDGVDFLVASSYKWLLGMHGAGVIYCAPHLLERLLPGAAGWYSVTDLFAPDRFERFSLKMNAGRFAGGMPNFASLYILRDSIQFFNEAGVARIDSDLRPTVKRAREGIASLGYELLTPADEVYASGIISFAHPAPEELGQALLERGVVVWAGDGRVRASIHVYNDETDIDCLIANLRELGALRCSTRLLV